MNWADWTIIGIIGLSVVVSLFRGFTREVFSLLVWVAAGWVALKFSGMLAIRLEGWIELPSARMMVAFAGVFLAALAVGALLGYLMGRLIHATGLSATDRLVGALFGALRGAVIVLVAVIVLSFTPVTEDPWWHESRLLPEFQRLADWALNYLPESVQEYLQEA